MIPPSQLPVATVPLSPGPSFLGPSWPSELWRRSRLGISQRPCHPLRSDSSLCGGSNCSLGWWGAQDRVSGLQGLGMGDEELQFSVEALLALRHEQEPQLPTTQGARSTLRSSLLKIV